MPQDKRWHSHWPDDVPKNVDLPEKTLPAQLGEIVRAHGDERAIVTQETTYTYNEVWENIGAVSGFIDNHL